MATKFKRGQKVRQIMPAAKEGTVSRIMFDEMDGRFHYHIGVAAPDGTVHDHSFEEDALELHPDQPAEAAPPAAA